MKKLPKQTLADYVRAELKEPMPSVAGLFMYDEYIVYKDPGYESWLGAKGDKFWNWNYTYLLIIAEAEGIYDK